MRPLIDALRVLTRLFFSRFFETESLSPQAEPASNVIQALGFLAAPGAFVALLFCLLPVTSSGWDLVAIRCLFLTYSMAVMGLIVVIKWNALFLDRRDYQILLPLPLPLWVLFLAKVLALGIFLAVFLIDINFLSSLFWPAVDEGSILKVIGVHLVAVASAGLFSALMAASFHGLLLSLIPTRLFQPVATVAQTVLMAALMMLLFVSPLLSSSLHELLRQRSVWVCYVPVFWFTGLYETLHPAVRNQSLLALGNNAVPTLGYALLLFVVTHVPLYRRHARKLLQAPPADPAGPGHLWRRINSWVDRTLLGNPTQQAVYHFIGQTISRSGKHRVFLAVYAGFGGAMLIIGWGDGREGLLRAPLMLTFVLISGLRAAFHFPAELGANWAFQITDTDHPRDCLVAMRKWIMACGVAPLLLLLVPVDLFLFPWTVVLFQFAFAVTLALLLIEIMFFSFHKIPFTCGYFPGKTNLVLLVVLYVAGFSLYSNAMARLEIWLLNRPLAAMGFFCFAAVLWFAIWNSIARDRSALEYLEDGNTEIRRLGLTAP